MKGNGGRILNLLIISHPWIKNKNRHPPDLLTHEETPGEIWKLAYSFSFIPKTQLGFNDHSDKVLRFLPLSRKLPRDNRLRASVSPW
ncbi:MAG: hypothetical protein RLY93_00090 [Sumerlaeia bacterium]